MKYSAVLVLTVLLTVPVFAAAEREVNPPSVASSSMSAEGGLTVCPHTGADAIINVDKSLQRGPMAQRVTLLCLAETIKNLQARVKELEAAKAK
jgi:hypothetical protein